MTTNGVAPIIRLAWRDARREWRRSLLTAVAVLVPVCLGAYLGPAMVGLGPMNLVLLVLIAVVIALSVGAVFAVSTKQRVVRYGRLTAIGAGPGQIKRLLFFEAVVPAASAYLVGLVIGTALSVVQGPIRWFLEDGGDGESAWGLLLRFPSIVHVLILFVAVFLAVATGLGLWFAVGPAAQMALSDSASEPLSANGPEPEPRPHQLAIGMSMVALSLVLCAGFQEFSFIVLTLAVVGVFVGLLLVMAPLLIIAERHAGRLPVFARLAVRNGARNRTRLGRLTLASLATVALGVMAAAGIASDSPDNPASGQALPMDERFVLLPMLPRGPETADHQLIRETISVVAEADMQPVFADLQLIRSRSGSQYSAFGAQTFVITPELINALAPDANTLAALERDELILASGVDLPVSGAGREPTDPDQDFATHAVRLGFGDGRQIDRPRNSADHTVLITPHTAAELGAWPLPSGRQWLFVADSPITEEQRRTLADGLVADVVVSAGDDVAERIFQRLVLGISAGFLFFFGLVGAALSGIETEREVATMIAAGARPSIRRWFRAAQAGLQLFTAGLVGAPLGVLLFWAATRTDASVPAAVYPWDAMLFLGVVVPAAVVLVVAATTAAGNPSVSRRAMV